MQNLSIDEIVSKIREEICFEATHNGDFTVKIQNYVPYVCAAIHDGHRLREDLADKCLLDEKERLYEEDPHTGEFIQSMPITLVGGDSRYEYDLNRGEESCIYNVAWGKEVWKKPLTTKQKEASLTKHRNFFRVVHALMEVLEKKFGACVVYDVHSYNYLRHETSYLFNIGIENIDIKRFNRHISHWKKQLMDIKIKKVATDVSVNHIFYGRGQLLKYAKAHFKNTLVLATEIKKVFMDELSGEKYPIIVQSIAKGLKRAIIQDAQYFINEHANVNVKKRGRLLHSELQPELLKLDKRLHALTKNFELLNFVNPINIHKEKKRFFKKDFNYNPEFRYRPLTLDPHEFKSKMYALKVSDIEDIHIRQIYMDIINAYGVKADMLTSLGTEKFLYNSLSYFGEPSAKDIDNAYFLLYCEELPQFKNEVRLEFEEVKERFEAEGKAYGFDYKVECVANIPSEAMVINSKKTVLLRKGVRFYPHRLEAILNHEIGVHMVTTMNALNQPLKFLSSGLPRNTYTQEGLALMAEYLGGGLSVTRMKELGLRVIAVSYLTKGYDFKTTFQKLHEKNYTDDDHLFNIVTRVYRGGGFTKDYLYLRGFRRISEMMAQGIDLSNLFLGKTSHQYRLVLNELVDRGMLNPPQYLCRAFEKPVAKDPILEYLTKSIR